MSFKNKLSTSCTPMRCPAACMRHPHMALTCVCASDLDIISTSRTPKPYAAACMRQAHAALCSTEASESDTTSSTMYTWMVDGCDQQMDGWMEWGGVTKGCDD